MVAHPFATPYPLKQTDRLTACLVVQAVVMDCLGAGR